MSEERALAILHGEEPMPEDITVEAVFDAAHAVGIVLEPEPVHFVGVP